MQLGVRFYWQWWPHRWKRSCLFRESCSQFVYRVAGESGSLAGLGAFWYRVRTCRPGYHLNVAGDQVELVLRDGSTLAESFMAPDLAMAARSAVGQSLG